MIRLKFKFWNKDNLEIDIEKYVYFVPMKGDSVLYKEKWYTVSNRGIDLDVGNHTKIHCREN